MKDSEMFRAFVEGLNTNDTRFKQAVLEGIDIVEGKPKPENLDAYLNTAVDDMRKKGMGDVDIADVLMNMGKMLMSKEKKATPIKDREIRRMRYERVKELDEYNEAKKKEYSDELDRIKENYPEGNERTALLKKAERDYRDLCIRANRTAESLARRWGHPISKVYFEKYLTDLDWDPKGWDMPESKLSVSEKQYIEENNKLWHNTPKNLGNQNPGERDWIMPKTSFSPDSEEFRLLEEANSPDNDDLKGWNFPTTLREANNL